ncbi:MAG: rod shape-determining protein MreC [Clostridiales bacterium]|nr:rod shape-determining protein MreC [Clostridiales bacterium]
MLEFLKTYKKQILILIAVFLAICALFTAGKNSRIPLIQNTIGVVIAPVEKVITSCENWISEKISWIFSDLNLEEENKQLKEKIAQLETDNKRLSLYEEQNRLLSDLLNISQKYSAYHTFGTQIIGKDPGNWYNTFLIDKGTKDGVDNDMVLTTSGGLVGRVIDCGISSSKAETIIDSRSSVSAMSLRTGDLGVVKGDYTLMNSGLCRMEYIDTEADIMEGDEIVTSHLSDVYPPGISIGYVKEIQQDSNGLTKYAIIQPQVDFKHLDTLLVIDKNTPVAPTDSLTSNSQNTAVSDNSEGE